MTRGSRANIKCATDRAARAGDGKLCRASQGATNNARQPRQIGQRGRSLPGYGKGIAKTVNLTGKLGRIILTEQRQFLHRKAAIAFPPIARAIAPNHRAQRPTNRSIARLQPFGGVVERPAHLPRASHAGNSPRPVKLQL